jgi:hypothetical protein
MATGKLKQDYEYSDSATKAKGTILKGTQVVLFTDPKAPKPFWFVTNRADVPFVSNHDFRHRYIEVPGDLVEPDPETELPPLITVSSRDISPEGMENLRRALHKNALIPPQALTLVPAPTGYVRVSKRWSRNSGFAQDSWLYYVDLVNSRDEVSTVNVHGRGMGYYGEDKVTADRIAAEQAKFFDWPIRYFEEDRKTTVTMKETTPNV